MFSSMEEGRTRPGATGRGQRESHWRGDECVVRRAPGGAGLLRDIKGDQRRWKGPGREWLAPCRIWDLKAVFQH